MNEITRRFFVAAVVAATLASGCGSKKESGGGSGTAEDPKPVDPKQPAKNDKTYEIAWSVWTGWMPFEVMEKKGFLKKRAEAAGIKVKLTKVKDYMATVTGFSSANYDGCAMTSMEALQPASIGVDTVAVIVNDTSNGGDGVLVRGIEDVKGLKGKEILLAEQSVSHYLLVRALDANGMKEADVKIKNVADGDAAGQAFVSGNSVEAVVTWNPFLYQAVEGGKGKIIFSSKQIPGEIIDLLVVNGKALKEEPKLAGVLVEAWYDAMNMFNDPKTRDEAIEIMAGGASVSADEFKKMLGGTDIYTDRARAGEFLEAASTKATMEKVRKFAMDHGLVKDASFAIGYGHAATEKLRFDASYTRAK
jgi:NitT/TauT family transport system substrate-binding protein